MKPVKIILEIIGWLQIVFAVTLAAALIAFMIYLKWSNNFGKMVAVIIVSVGFITGVIWATLIWKKHGTIEWLSNIRKVS